MSTSAATKRILIFRPGSLGDTLVTLPMFHLLARRFPAADKRVLCYRPADSVCASLKSVLDGTNLVQGYFEVDFFSVRHQLRAQLELRRQLRSWQPDLLVYMTDPRSLPRLLAEVMFFKSCGIRRIAGVGWAKSLREYRWIPEQQTFEHEAERIARSIEELGDPRLDDPQSWDLRLAPIERARAAAAVRDSIGDRDFLVFATGTAMDVNDWGEDKWLEFTERLAGVAGSYGLALVGAEADRARSETLARVWPGPSLNLCGKLTPRESAALMELATLFVGHDSGPIHLAATIGLPCVGIFSARNQPGPWFPFGQGHRVIYHQVECYGCELEKCERYAKKCIASIAVDEVLEAVTELLSRAEQERAGTAIPRSATGTFASYGGAATKPIKQRHV